MFAHPPRFIDYFTLNGHAPEDITQLSKFKTVVVANQRAYAGNFTQDGVRYADRMIKSPPGQYDKFPSTRFVDIVTDDGDEIVYLTSFADRVLQFKRKRLYIINIAEDTEYLESEHKFMGVLTPAAVVVLESGVAWVNHNGVYFYDGKTIHSLMEREGFKRIDSNFWFDSTGSAANFMTRTGYYPMIGYIKDRKQLLVTQSASANGTGDIMIYDMPTASWTRGKTKLTGTSVVSNFVNDWDGNLLFYDYGGNDGDPDGAMKQWNSAPAASSTFKLATRDIDFGYPGLYKVYISYKGDASAIRVKYGVNGETDVDDMYQFNSDDTPLENKTDLESWHRAELKPTTKAEANGIYSFRLHLDETAAANFEINDMTILYRIKGVK